MTRSYQKINYSIRPAKNIERKMICDALRKLTEFRLLETYRYIGFGSLYFSDFMLFHKALNIKVMVSIENEENPDRKKRFLLNRPFGCIDMQFGHSNEILPRLDWNDNTITWLDYDGSLNESVLEDIKTICKKVTSGSILLISVNAHPGVEKEENGEDRLDRLKKAVGEEKVPIDVFNNHLPGWGTAAVLRRIIDNEIKEALANRNGVLREGSKIQYKQLFNFHYKDGANMLTVGGIFFDQGTQHKVSGCGFDSLPFVKIGDQPFKIEVPSLTYRELRMLDNHLPLENELPKLDGIPESDIKTYSEVYRYFPNFAEAEL
ncbi:O-methyltransferase [Pseudanabaena sp. UWO310]|uniref:O-methyltransferase n=1 Tax=Pseudanabaena sp. UWO310 TaxID=2480795 RepID=UPI0011583CB0|nr:O-methyltransferase [Pseudanabaena sp. UWO310]TYQ28169.1 hypothetical protein PseudUWO310_14625 [Pseudanabaena sp. UWO310]